MSKRTRAAERFSAIPRRVDEAIDREELSSRRGELLKRLIYRCGAAGQTSFTLAELAEWLRGWELTLEALRLDLKALEAAGWISLDSPGPGRSAWTLTLLGAALELNSKRATAANGRAADSERDSGSRPFPTSPAVASTDRDTDADEDLEDLSADDLYAAEVAAIVAALPDPDPVVALLNELPDRDVKTEGVLRLKFPNLTKEEVASALARLEWRNRQATAGARTPLRRQTAYVIDQLKRQRGIST